MNKHNIARLDDAELAFLKKYRPADDVITTPAEKGEIIRQLSLMSYKTKNDLQLVRNAVVSVFDDGGMSAEGMQSVTAVIDHLIFTL